MKLKTVLIIVIIIAAFLRLFMLSSVPAGITSDEADTGYDAYSIIKTGHDQWGQTYPLVSFRGFGDYRMPIYTYFVSSSMSLFGVSELAVRLPSAIAGVFSVFFIYLLSRKIFGEKAALLSSFLFAFSPWAIGMSRQGIESNLAMTFYIFALFLFLKIKEGKKFLLLSLLFFILSMYSYTSYIISTPLTVLVLSIINLRQLLKIKKEASISITLFVVSILPLIFLSSAGTKRASQIGFMSDITSLGIIDVLNLKIGACYQILPSFFCRALDNKPLTFLSVFANNYLHHFSLDFLYLKGTTTQFSLLPERGLLYSYEIIFLLLGLFFIFKKRKGIFIVVLFLLAAVPDSLSGGGHHSRALCLLPFIILIEGAGLTFLIIYIGKLRRELKYLLLSALSILILFSLSSFIISYFSYFQKYYSPYSLYAYKQMSKELPDFSKKYESVYISNYLNDEPQYIFYLFYNKYDPVKFQKKENITYTVDQKTGFIKITKIGNINFTDFRMDNGIPDKYKSQKSLFIASPDAFSKSTAALKSFKSLSGGVIFQAVEYNNLEKALNE